MLNKMELEQQIRAMDDRALLEFTARQMAEFLANCEQCKTNIDGQFAGQSGRLHKLETSDRRGARNASLIAAGISGAVAGIGLLVKWFKS